MSWLVENPLPVIYVTVLVELILLGMLVLTGRGVALIAMLGVAALAGVLLLVEHLVVTDVEDVEDMLAATAQAIASNDAESVKQYIAPEDTATRDRVDWMFRRYVFERITIKSNLKVDVEEGQPKTASATFNAVAVGGDKNGSSHGVMVPRFLKVSLRKDGDRWVITDHEESDPIRRAAESFGQPK